MRLKVCLAASGEIPHRLERVKKSMPGVLRARTFPVRTGVVPEVACSGLWSGLSVRSGLMCVEETTTRANRASAKWSSCVKSIRSACDLEDAMARMTAGNESLTHGRVTIAPVKSIIAASPHKSQKWIYKIKTLLIAKFCVSNLVFNVTQIHLVDLAVTLKCLEEKNIYYQ